MRVLLATDRCFLPPTDGASCIYGIWLRALVDLGLDVSVLSFDHGRSRWSAQSIAEARAQAKLHVVPFVGSRTEAASRRIYGQLHQLATGRRHLPASFGQPWSAGSRSALASVLMGTQWDAVIVQYLHTVGMIGGDLLRALGCKLMVYLHDSMPLRRSLTRASVRRALAEGTWPLLRALQPQELTDAMLPGELSRAVAEEVALLRGFDDVLFASDEERLAYEAAGLDPACCRVHVTAPIADPMPDFAAGSTRPEFDIGFIGGVNVFNLEALAFLARDILPRLERKLGRPPAVLLGGRCAAAMRALFADRPGVVIEPWVAHIPSFYARVGVVVVPMLSGSGVSTKTIEAAGFGAALVTTSPGVRGCALTPGKEFELADDPEVFAAAVAALTADPARRRALGRQAYAAFTQYHSLGTFTRQVGTLLGVREPVLA